MCCIQCDDHHWVVLAAPERRQPSIERCELLRRGTGAHCSLGVRALLELDKNASHVVTANATYCIYKNKDMSEGIR